MKHRVRISVCNGDGNAQHVVTSRKKKIPSLLARLLFGGFSEVVILTPGKSVQGIEICEVPDEKC